MQSTRTRKSKSNGIFNYCGRAIDSSRQSIPCSTTINIWNYTQYLFSSKCVAEIVMCGKTRSCLNVYYEMADKPLLSSHRYNYNLLSRRKYNRTPLTCTVRSQRYISFENHDRRIVVFGVFYASIICHHHLSCDHQDF